MSYFSCISFDSKKVDKIQNILQEDANNFDIGKKCRGGKEGYLSYLLKPLYHAATLEIANHEKNDFFQTIEKIKKEAYSFYLIIHWGDIDEEFELKGTKEIFYSQFKEKFPESLDEEVRYKVIFEK